MDNAFANIRLQDCEISAIREAFVHLFPGDKLWIFGSRVDPSKKGGDIDLYIETNCQDPAKIVDKRLNFLYEIQNKIGEQKIDVVVKFREFPLPIYQIARKEGIQLV